MKSEKLKMVTTGTALVKPALKRLSGGKLKGTTLTFTTVALVVSGIAARSYWKKSKAKTNQEDNGKVFRLQSADDGWKISLDGAESAEGIEGIEGIETEFSTKAEAMIAARELAQNNQPSEVVVYLEDGAEQARHLYGVH